MPRSPQKSEGNLRGRTVLFTWSGRKRLGVVITRIKGSWWQVSSPAFPVSAQWPIKGRATLDRSEFTVKPDAA